MSSDTTTVLDDFLSSISFRFLQPDVVQSRSLKANLKRLQKIGFYFDVWNTRFNDGGRDYRSILNPVCRIERMSTFAVGAIIHKIVSLMPEGQTFVNVGVWKGFTFFSALAGHPGVRCVGVDNFSQFYGPKEVFLREFYKNKSENHFFYEKDYVEYFRSEHEGRIGFYIYDGEHSYENQLKGLQVAEPFFAEGCYVMVDDTNLPDVRRGTMDFIEQSNNRYEVVFDRSTAENMHPTFWNGVMILRLIGGRPR